MKNEKKPFYKALWFWTLVVIVLIGVSTSLEKTSPKKMATGVETKVDKHSNPKDSDDKKEEEDAKGKDSETAESDTKDDVDIKSMESDTEEAPSSKVNPTDGMDYATQNAYQAAISYLEYTGFSKAGLIDQLSSEYGDNYTVQQATDAVSALETSGLVDWNEQAVRSGQSYLEYSSFSRQGLIDQLSSAYGGKYTLAQATYAADQLGLR